MVAPGPVGAHNWYPMSYSPLTGLVYIPALEAASYYKHDDKFEFRDRTWNTGLSTTRDPANAQTVADCCQEQRRRFADRVGPRAAARGVACGLSARRQRRHAVDGRQARVPGLGRRASQRIRGGLGREAVVVRHAERNHGRPDDVRARRRAAHRNTCRHRRRGDGRRARRAAGRSAASSAASSRSSSAARRSSPRSRKQLRA